MKVRFTTSFATTKGDYQSGSEADIPTRLAARLIREGAAVSAEGSAASAVLPGLETTEAAPAPERAVKQTRPRKPRSKKAAAEKASDVLGQD